MFAKLSPVMEFNSLLPSLESMSYLIDHTERIKSISHPKISFLILSWKLSAGWSRRLTCARLSYRLECSGNRSADMIESSSRGDVPIKCIASCHVHVSSLCSAVQRRRQVEQKVDFQCLVQRSEWMGNQSVLSSVQCRAVDRCSVQCSSVEWRDSTVVWRKELLQSDVLATTWSQG
jgi:hypothetical protein